MKGITGKVALIVVINAINYGAILVAPSRFSSASIVTTPNCQQESALRSAVETVICRETVTFR